MGIYKLSLLLQPLCLSTATLWPRRHLPVLEEAPCGSGKHVHPPGCVPDLPSVTVSLTYKVTQVDQVNMTQRTSQQNKFTSVTHNGRVKEANLHTHGVNHCQNWAISLSTASWAHASIPECRQNNCVVCNRTDRHLWSRRFWRWWRLPWSSSKGHILWIHRKSEEQTGYFLNAVKTYSSIPPLAEISCKMTTFVENMTKESVSFLLVFTACHYFPGETDTWVRGR